MYTRAVLIALSQTARIRPQQEPCLVPTPNARARTEAYRRGFLKAAEQGITF